MAISHSPHYLRTRKLEFFRLLIESLLKNLHKFALNNLKVLLARIARINC